MKRILLTILLLAIVSAQTPVKMTGLLDAEYFDIETFDDEVFEKIKKINPDLIVLAGFLKKISLKFLTFFPKKIINNKYFYNIEQLLRLLSHIFFQ